ncbi:tetratricopeptide repeat protein [Streptomyces sp. NPDC048419]|uniref:tetratricopeptide repeat protein n=1 Tax=Streptomyces sp. NPDC048419 TaxID=3365547 RepID=UPI00371A6F4A
MAQTEPSLQQLNQQSVRAGFVGREAERDLFLRNFDIPPGDDRHFFRFHVHGPAGVGKTSLIREWRHLARERGALTVYVGEGAGSVPAALEVTCRQFADQSRRLRALERRLATYRDRRREAEAAALAASAPEPPTASAGSTAAVQAGIGLVDATVPFAGVVTRGIPADRLAQGADRLWAGLGARFRSEDDRDLVLTPEKVLTPLLLRDLRDAASGGRWIVLFFDTYERTGPYLEPWLHEMLTGDEEVRRLPATLVVVTAGQSPRDSARGGGLYSVADVALEPFTDEEARRLLAARGVVAEPVVEEVLRLTGGLPVLVSTLAKTPPVGPEGVRDPSRNAVSRFLDGEPKARRDVATLCALPRWLDADVFRVLVDRPDDERDELYEWLTGLPFVDQGGERTQYHDVVRPQMLRLERREHPRTWAPRHRKLAEAYDEWRADSEAGREDEALWEDEEWRALLLEETYHRLCARPPAALADALRRLVEACHDADEVVGRRWARMLQDAGAATDHPVLLEWGRELAEALADDETGVIRAMDLLLARPGLDGAGRAMAHVLRARELRRGREYARALADLDHAVELDPQQYLVHYGRGLTLQLMDDFPAALSALDRAAELSPDTGWIIAERAETYRLAARFEEAVADFDRAVALDPTDAVALTGRAVSRHGLGQYDASLADFNRALSIDDDLWTLVRKARLHGSRGESDQAFADFDLAVSRAPEAAWIASERGDAYRRAGRLEDAVAELGRAVSLKPDYPSALGSRGAALLALGRDQEALDDLDRAVELKPDYSWAMWIRSQARDRLGDRAGMYEDLHRAVELDPEVDAFSHQLGEEYRLDRRYEEAIVLFHRVLDLNPDYDPTLAGLGAVLRAQKAYQEALPHLDRALELDPEDGWAYGQRARVLVATGRVDRALADLDRCVALGTEADWARRRAVDVLQLTGRWDEADARLADAEREAEPDTELDELRIEMHRHHGQWAEARRRAEALREAEPLVGTYHLAMTVSRSEGLRAAEPLWRELARFLHESDQPNELERAQGRCFVGCALADWAEADRGLAEFLASTHDWDDLAYLASFLTELRQSPDADTARLTRYLTAVTEADN